MTRIRTVIGTSLALLLAATGACAFPAVAIAAQSQNFLLHEVGPGHAAGVTLGSTNYQMQGDVTWRQEAPLTGQTYQISNTPPALPSSSSSVATSSAQASTDPGGGGTSPTRPPVSPVPRVSSSSSSSAAPTVPSTSSSSAPTSASASSARPVPGPVGASSSVPVASSVSSDATSSQHTSALSSDVSASDASSSVASSVASSSADGAIRPAAPVEPKICPEQRYTVLCPERFYANTPLTPVQEETSNIAGDMTRAVAGIAAIVGVDPSVVWMVLGAIILSLVFGLFNSHAADVDARTRRLWYGFLIAFAMFGALFASVHVARAAVSSPQRYVYNGHLLNASGQPVTTPHYIRFSEWYSRDMVEGDVVSGIINVSAPAYAGYQEVHVVTPDSRGFFSVELGSDVSLPDIASMAPADLDNLFLQVEVKAAGSPDSAYELLDVNPSNDAVDRSPLLSVPFAQNADLLDQRDIGTGSGSIPLLGPGGMLPVATVPGGTNQDTFVIDADNTAATQITLQFGEALARTLTYDLVADRFTFSADVRIEGDLVVTGLINGIDISTIAGSDDGKLRVSSGGGLTVNVTGGSYRINGNVTDFTGASGVPVPANATSYVFIGSGGLTVRTSGYPTDESFIRLATVITNGAGVTQVNDHRIVQSDDREQVAETNMHAEFPNTSYQADATENVGQLSVSLDNITQRNFYQWTSTRTTLQDYDVVVRVSLPADFVRWDASPMSVSYRTTSADAANSKVDVSVFDTNGTPVTLGGSATGLASTSWATSALTYGGAPTWTAGQEFLVKFKLHAKDNFQAHVGSMKLKYIRLTR